MIVCPLVATLKAKYLDVAKKMTVLTDRLAVHVYTVPARPHHLLAEPDGLDEEDDGVVDQVAVHDALGLQAVQLRRPTLHVTSQRGNLSCRLLLGSLWCWHLRLQYSVAVA